VCTSDALQGVLTAEKQLHRGPYPLYTWDVSAPALAGVKSGSVSGLLYMPTQASANQLGSMIASYMKSPKAWKAKTINAAFVVLTKKNVAKYAATALNG